jgi:S-formylglutathione hydrolase FrmB
VRRRRPLTPVLVAVLLAAFVAAPARAADHGIQLLSSERLDSRLTELTLSTPALRQPTRVRVLLPAGYGPGTHSWPYWQRDLSEALPFLVSTLSSPTGVAVGTARP